MTAVCRVCGSEIAQKFVGTTVIWGHVVNPRNGHHYATPKRTPNAKSA